MSPPMITFVVLADSHKQHPSGKFDLSGVFNIANVWAVPAPREFSLAFGVANLPAGTTSLTVWLRRKRRPPIEIASVTLQGEERAETAIFAQRLSLRLEELGAQTIAIGVGKTFPGGRAGSVPFVVNQLPWPALPKGSALQKALSNPRTMKAGRAVLRCEKCKSDYVFQINLDPAKPLPQETLPFPIAGSFACPVCGIVHPLRDIEGLLRHQMATSAQTEAQP